MTQKFYTKDHEWLSLEDDIVTIGVTDFAQEQLGDVVLLSCQRLELI